MSLYSRGKWEEIIYALAVFEKDKDKLIFKGFINNMFSNLYGNSAFKLFSMLPDGSFILNENVIRDAEDPDQTMQILNIYHWKRPFLLKKIYSRSLTYDIGVIPKGNEFEIRNDTLNNVLLITKPKMKYLEWDSKDINQYTDTLRLNIILK